MLAAALRAARLRGARPMVGPCDSPTPTRRWVGPGLGLCDALRADQPQKTKPNKGGLPRQTKTNEDKGQRPKQKTKRTTQLPGTMSEDFQIWPQLAGGKIELLKWPLSLVLLMEDKNFPWIVLVRCGPPAAYLSSCNHSRVPRASTGDPFQSALRSPSLKLNDNRSLGGTE